MKLQLPYDEHIKLIKTVQSHMKEAYCIDIGLIATQELINLIYSNIEHAIIKPLRKSDQILHEIKKLL
ncbi:hypothetical protein LCY76_23010 [Fictibacillus sp. KIGAM418]|uniref:Uncharacterized protein n=1 Tax=Fictibacillus marinisediminis TaxID=2878389 RepID=A0A9X1XGE6_9BACL|nr:hypothetical protein [Fictibacillus marinisediminis]MCK6259445.1 hypothetical protein [Fictibacillus marinisediminis]